MTAAMVAAQGGGNSFSAALVGAEETPSVSTAARGSLTLTIDDAQEEISYTLTYDGLQGVIQQAHIHFGQPGVAGGIILWLCKTAAAAPNPVNNTPDCPGQGGTVSGVLEPADVRAAQAAQQLTAGEFKEAVAAIRAGLAYGNVHSSISPTGEIRGQLRAGGGHK
jgi:hypothetical protein